MKLAAKLSEYLENVQHFVGIEQMFYYQIPDHIEFVSKYEATLVYFDESVYDLSLSQCESDTLLRLAYEVISPMRNRLLPPDDEELIETTKRLGDLLTARGLNHVSVFAGGSVCVAERGDAKTIYAREGMADALAQIDERATQAHLLETFY